MQCIIALLVVLVGVAFAHRMDISSDDLKQKNKDISATEYLKKIFKKPLYMHFDIDIDASGQDDPIDDLIARLPALGLNEASAIAREVDLKQIVRDSGSSSTTICLPSDEAVQKWKRELATELKPEALKQLVKAWIIPGVIRSSTIINNEKVQSLNGAKLRLNVYSDNIITVNGARVIDADRIIGNTMLHIVDKVIFPLPSGNVIQTVSDIEAFSVIVDLLKIAGLEEVLADADPITVFLPINKALTNLRPGVLEDLKRNKGMLRELLKYHVISDVKYSASLSSGQRITAMQGDEILVNIENGKVILNKEMDKFAANVIQADIPTTNGVIHVIDHALFESITS